MFALGCRLFGCINFHVDKIKWFQSIFPFQFQPSSLFKIRRQVNKMNKVNKMKYLKYEYM